MDEAEVLRPRPQYEAACSLEENRAVSFGRNHEESSGCASPVAQGEGGGATLKAASDLNKPLLYLLWYFAVAAHVMVDDKALASHRVGCQFIEVYVLGAPLVVALGARLKAVVGVDEDHVAGSRRVVGTFYPVGSQSESRVTRSGSDVRHAAER